MASTVETAVLEELSRFLSPIMARSVLQLAVSKSGCKLDHGSKPDVGLLAALEQGVRLYVDNSHQASECMDKVRQAWNRGLSKQDTGGGAAHKDDVTIPILDEADIVRARGTGREICARLGFTPSAQVKAATLISELTRNIVLYAKTGEVRLSVTKEGTKSALKISARDQGPGITGLDVIMSGNYRSKSGLGMGLMGCKRLADSFHIETGPGKGTHVVAVMVVK